MSKKLMTLLLALAMLLSLAACGGQQAAAPEATEAPAAAEEPAAADTPAPEPEEAAPETITDPSGATVTVPEDISSIVTLAPSLTEMVVALGCGDAIAACDTQSAGLDGLNPDVPVFDMVNPDMESLAALKPDLLLVSNMSLYDQQDPYQPLIDMGVCVACVPNAESIQGIYDDIAFLGQLLGRTEEADGLAADMRASIDAIAAVGSAIPEEERKSVYFEISAAPYMYSFGSGVYLDEMISLIGAENILADQTGWLSVEGETVVAAAPDVILTNVNYIDDPVGEILGRDGWAGVPAVADGAVYYIDNMASSLPNHNIVTALEQMAQAVYPTYFAR